MGKSDTEQLSRPALRAEYMARGSRELVRALLASDITQHEIAEECARAPSIVQRWADHHAEGYEPKVSDLAMLPREVALHLLRWIAAQHLAKVVDALPAATSTDVMTAVSRAQREAAETSLAACEALRDGVVSDDEARLIAKEAEEAGRAFFGLAEAMRARLAVQ